MTKAFPPRPSQDNWKALYREALLETSKHSARHKILAAEQAILARGLELFYSVGSIEEKGSLEDALYALRAFKRAWEHTEAA